MWAIYSAFILASGYLYTYAHLPSRFKLKKSSGQHTYAIIIGRGLVLFLQVLVALCPIAIAIRFLSPYWGQYLHLSNFFLIVSIGTLIFALVCSLRFNKNYKEKGNRIKAFREIAKEDAIENLCCDVLDRSVEEGVFLQVTLKSRKTYIGLIHETKIENPDTETLTLIPMLSGYRDDKDLSLKITTNYYKFYEKNGLEHISKDFRVLIPLAEVSALSLFILDNYIMFQASGDHTLQLKNSSF